MPRDRAGARQDDRVAAAWRALSAVEDPEIPALSLVDLGIIRFVETQADGVLKVGLSPTYTGCPATEVIRQLVEEALAAAPVGEFAVTAVLSPAWTSDWITAEGRRKLAAYGIVPPVEAVSSARQVLRETRPIGMPALQFGRYGMHQPIWLDALQGTASLPSVPGAFRILQMHLAGLAC